MAKYVYEKWNLGWDYEALNIESTQTFIEFNPTMRIDLDGVAREVETTDLVGGDLILKNSYLMKYNAGQRAIIYKYDGIRVNKYLYCSQLSDRLSSEQLLVRRTKKDLVETLVAEEGEYPENGIQGSYWYVRGEKAFPSLKIQGIGNISGAKLKDSTGQIRNVGNVYFKDSNGLVKNLK